MLIGLHIWGASIRGRINGILRYLLKKANSRMCQIAEKMKKIRVAGMWMFREWKTKSDWKTSADVLRARLTREAGL